MTRDCAPPTRAVFVVGVARSGTTLLVRLLDAHPQLFVLPCESHAVDWCGAESPVAAFIARRGMDGPFFRDGKRRVPFEQMLGRMLPGPASLPDALRALVASYAHYEPPPESARAWVEKTPKHLRNVPLLLHAFGPDTRFVCMVRDPRAVMASQFERWDRGALRHVRTFAARWAEADRLTARFEADIPQFRVVRYEDLVAKPEATMRGVAAHLGIDWDEILLAPTARGAEWRGNTSANAPQSGISAESVSRYVDQLGPDALREIERIVAPRIVARGYDLADRSALRPSLRRAIAEAHAWARVRREARSWPRE